MSTASIIIVSHNSIECIESCLRALSTEKAWQVVLVDNASNDQTVERARRCIPSVTVQENSVNVGFAGAVNQGAKIADGDILVVLNPDCVLVSGSLDRLAQALEDGQVGAAGGLLLDSDRNVEKGFTIRRFPSLTYVLCEVLLLNRVWPKNPWNRRFRYLDADYTRVQEVDQPAGACLAIRRKAWEEVNGFDENFFPVWFEDVDFCRRLRDRGWTIMYCPQAIFEHRGGHSVSKLKFRDRQSYWYGNLLRYFGKHHSRSSVACLRLGVAVGLILRSVLSLLGAAPPGVTMREALAGYWHALWEYAVMGRSLGGSAKAVLASPAT
jgi:GT2 family glycosyltransferase